jgi:hypothetical protein
MHEIFYVTRTTGYFDDYAGTIKPKIIVKCRDPKKGNSEPGPGPEKRSAS